MTRPEQGGQTEQGGRTGQEHRTGGGYRRLTRRSLLGYWWTVPVAGTLGTFGWLSLRAGTILTRKRTPGEPEFTPAPPQALAPLGDFAAEWDSLEFSYQGQAAVAMRVPQPVLGGLDVDGQHFVAFFRNCTHQGCPVVMVRDPEVLALAYNYRSETAQHPQLGCPCHYSVFDPLRAGEAVFGQATLPLPRIALQARDQQLYAVGTEDTVT